MTLGENSKIAVGVVLTAVIMYALNFVIDTGEAGIDAKAEAQISAVVEAALEADREARLLPDGRTLGAAVVSIEGELVGINRVIDIILAAPAT